MPQAGGQQQPAYQGHFNESHCFVSMNSKADMHGSAHARTHARTHDATDWICCLRITCPSYCALTPASETDGMDRESAVLWPATMYSLLVNSHARTSQ